MDRRLLAYFTREITHLREAGGEFARAFPKIAGRLTLDEFGCADPYVERLLEGFAFLAARVHLKLDAEFPRFTECLLETLYPNYLAPIPSMMVAQLEADETEGSLAEGFTIPRGAALRSQVSRGDPTACEYRTAHEVVLWPIRVTEASYYTRELSSLGVPPGLEGIRAGIRIRLQATAGLSFDKISLDKLCLYLRGSGEIQGRLYEQIVGHTKAIVLQPTSKPCPWREVLPSTSIHQVGFENNQSLLPADSRVFSGYRLLTEYFAFPERFMFFELSGLTKGIRQCHETQIDLLILLDQADLKLENNLAATNFAPACTPALNLFPKRADRILLTDKFSEFQVIPDRTRTLDFEVYRVLRVSGFSARSEQTQEFLPFYSINDTSDANGAYYAVNRVSRVSSDKERRNGARSRYAGSEVYLSLVDASAAPYRTDLRQLGVEILATNRDLPLFIPIGRGNTDFNLDLGAPVRSVRCISGPPTPPRASFAEGEFAWRLISHLSLNYLSLIDSDSKEGAASLRDLLRLNADTAEPHIRKQIEGVKSITCKPRTCRVPAPGPIVFARGLELSVVLDDLAFEGTGVFPFSAVLERFFARYVSINSFTQMVVKSTDRGEVMRWPARIGQRHLA